MKDRSEKSEPESESDLELVFSVSSDPAVKMYSASAEDATNAAATYKALVDYYANARSAASHIVSLTLSPLNETLSLGLVDSGNGSANGPGSNSSSSIASYDDDALGGSNFFLIPESASTETSGGAPAGAAAAGAVGVAAGGRGSGGSSSGTSAPEMPAWLIPSYSLILLCAIVGNLLVISTLMQNRRMRTITNLFLLNLAISDMLLGVLCMPVTLVGTMLRNFIFGEFLCKLIQFSQGKCLSASANSLIITPELAVVRFGVLLGICDDKVACILA